jgi:hypothetical protein
MPFARPTSSDHGRMQTKSEACVRTKGRYRKATSLSHRHPLKELNAFNGIPALDRSWIPFGGLARGRDCAIFIGSVKDGGRSGVVAALMPRRAGR